MSEDYSKILLKYTDDKTTYTFYKDGKYHYNYYRYEYDSCGADCADDNVYGTWRKKNNSNLEFELNATKKTWDDGYSKGEKIIDETNDLKIDPTTIKIVIDNRQ